MTRFEHFQAVHEDALATIHRMANDPGREEINGLAKWLLETDANPYSFLPYSWAGYMDSAEGFASLLSAIHHAVYDDGAITFVKVKGEPRISFVDRFDARFSDRVLGEVERDRGTVEVLDIRPNQFGEVYDAWFVQDLRQLFRLDARAHGVEFAEKHYAQYKLYDPQWGISYRRSFDETEESR